MPIPSMYKPGRGAGAKVSVRANLPLKSKSPLRAASRSSWVVHINWRVGRCGWKRFGTRKLPPHETSDDAPSSEWSSRSIVGGERYVDVFSVGSFTVDDMVVRCGMSSHSWGAMGSAPANPRFRDCPQREPVTHTYVDGVCRV